MKKEKALKLKDDPTISVYYMRVPTDVKNTFKAYCALRGKNMSQLIIRFMKKSMQEAKVKAE